MKNNNTSSNENNNMELIAYSILGGAIISAFIPTYMPVVVCGSGLILSLYGVVNILDKYKDTEDINFISKENIEYFNKK